MVTVLCLGHCTSPCWEKSPRLPERGWALDLQHRDLRRTKSDMKKQWYSKWCLKCYWYPRLIFFSWSFGKWPFSSQAGLTKLISGLDSPPVAWREVSKPYGSDISIPVNESRCRPLHKRTQTERKIMPYSPDYVASKKKKTQQYLERKIPKRKVSLTRRK